MFSSSERLKPRSRHRDIRFPSGCDSAKWIPGTRNTCSASKENRSPGGSSGNTSKHEFPAQSISPSKKYWQFRSLSGRNEIHVLRKNTVVTRGDAVNEFANLCCGPQPRTPHSLAAICLFDGNIGCCGLLRNVCCLLPKLRTVSNQSQESEARKKCRRFRYTNDCRDDLCFSGKLKLR